MKAYNSMRFNRVITNTQGKPLMWLKTKMKLVIPSGHVSNIKHSILDELDDQTIYKG